MLSPTPNYYEVLNLSPAAVSPLDDAAAAAVIKRAYRRALLNHHPDKKPARVHHPHLTSPPLSEPSPPSSFTIDQISAAYATLSRPSQRQAYDRSLLLLRRQTHSQPQSQHGNPDAAAAAAQDFQTGIETVDLDDLALDEEEEEEGEGEDKEGGDVVKHRSTTLTTTTTTPTPTSPTTTPTPTKTRTKTAWYRACRCGNPRGYHFTEDDLEDAAELGELMVGCDDCSLWLRVHFAVLDDDDDDGGDGGGDGGSHQVGNGNAEGGGAEERYSSSKGESMR